MHQQRINPKSTSTPLGSSFDKTDTGSLSSWISTLGAALLSAYLIQKILLFSNYSLLSVFETLWNCFVYLMPSPLVFALRARSNFPGVTETDGASAKHAAKSEVLRNVFGLDKSGAQAEPQESERIPAGLGNWDNSCYQNSVLQSLASITSLRSMFENVQSITKVETFTNTTLSSLSNLIHDLNQKKNSAWHLWTPPKLKSMSSWQQQDAQEYYSKIVEQLEKDIDAILKTGETTKPGLELPLDAVDLSSKSLATQQHNNEHMATSQHSGEADARSNNVQNPLEGLLAQRVGCTKCGYTEGLSLIPFNCITLPIGHKWQYQLSDCFEAFSALEYIEGVECAKCTLLQSRHQLRQLSETLATGEEEDEVMSVRREEQQQMVDARLEAVTEAIMDEDFTDSTLNKKCHIPSALRVLTTKSRQAIVARPPKCLVMHVNRSLFDETTGEQLKNYADVQFDSRLDLTRWCVGNKQKMEMSNQPAAVEEWEMNPSRSMIHEQDCFSQTPTNLYDLQAVITHYGRHENGHYICYRKVPMVERGGSSDQMGQVLETSEQWWRLSDENVSRVSEEEVLAQGGVFMLFYERVGEKALAHNERHKSTLSDTPLNAALGPMAAGVAEMLDALPLGNIAELHDDSILPVRTSSLPNEAQVSMPATESKGRTNLAENKNPTEPYHQSATVNDRYPAKHKELLPQAPSPTEAQKKNVSPLTMRTSGLTHRRSDDLSPLKPLRMVATL